jgi:hypothetical protein
MDGILTLAQVAERLGIPLRTLQRALRFDAPDLRVELLPGGKAWGVRVEDLPRVAAALEARRARRGRKGWPRVRNRRAPGRTAGQKEVLGSSQTDTPAR